MVVLVVGCSSGGLVCILCWGSDRFLWLGWNSVNVIVNSVSFMLFYSNWLNSRILFSGGSVWLSLLVD